MEQVEKKKRFETGYSLFPCVGGKSIVIKSVFDMNGEIPVPIKPAMGTYRLNEVPITNKNHLKNIAQAITCIEECKYLPLNAVSWEDDDKYRILTKMGIEEDMINVMLRVIASDREPGGEAPMAKFIWLDTGEIVFGEKELEP